MKLAKNTEEMFLEICLQGSNHEDHIQTDLLPPRELKPAYQGRWDEYNHDISYNVDSRICKPNRPFRKALSLDSYIPERGDRTADED